MIFPNFLCEPNRTNMIWKPTKQALEYSQSHKETLKN